MQHARVNGVVHVLSLSHFVHVPTGCLVPMQAVFTYILMPDAWHPATVEVNMHDLQLTVCSRL